MTADDFRRLAVGFDGALSIRWLLGGRMKRAGLLAIVICAALAAALGAVQSSSGSAYAGTWAGTWEGPGTGQFDMTIENGKDGPTGKVAVTTDNGNYNADLKAIVFDGNKMTAKYDFPLDTSAEVAVTATFEARAAKGTWSLRAKGQDGELASGTFTTTKK